MIKFSRVLLASIAFIPSACTTLQNQSRVDPQTIAIYPQILAVDVDCRKPRVPGDTRTGAINIKCLKLPTGRVTGDRDTDDKDSRDKDSRDKDSRDNDNETLIYNEAVTSPTARNRLGSVLIKQSDDICTVEMGRLTANEAIVNTTLSTATSVLTTLGSLVTGETLQKIFTGGASVTNATRDHFRAEVYRNLLTSQVTKAIRLARATYLTQLKNRYGSTIEEYNVDDMIRDVNQYHGICSFYAGLGLVDAAVSRTGAHTPTEHERLTQSINELGVRINALNDAMGKANISDTVKAGLVTQRDALMAQQTALFKKRSELADSDKSSGDQDPVSEQAVPGTADPGNEGGATDAKSDGSSGG